MNQLQIINTAGVRGYLNEDGMAMLNLEDISRGLGFTTVATSGNECIRWSRVNGYLEEFGFTSKGESEVFIPENIFYRLAMKAKNEAAVKFQILIADEILPTIRKTGSYTVKPMSTNEMLMLQVQINSELENKIEALNARTREVEAKIEKALEEKPTDLRAKWQDDIFYIAEMTGMAEVNVYGRLYGRLEHLTSCNLDLRLKNLKQRMKQAGSLYRDCHRIGKLDAILLDKKLSDAFTAIVEHALKVASFEHSHKGKAELRR